jgi:hypothetical protein
MRPIFMIFPLPEAEGAPELHPNFHFQPKRSGHPDWAQENLDKNNGQTLS